METGKMTIQELMFHIENPQVYSGREINVIRKHPGPGDRLHICLVFPDKYDIGMSHYGLQLLYHQLNRLPQVVAERCFLPDKSAITVFKQHQVPLFSLESKRPLKDFDLIGFSLLSEMNYTNVLQVLDLAGIPLLSRDRDHDDPLVAAGGICSINPEPLRDFIDVFAFGDGEALFPEILDVLVKVGGKKGGRETIIDQFSHQPGLYVPARVPVHRQGRFYLPALNPGQIEKQTIADIDESFPDEKLIVPITNVVFNRLTVEIARGCPQTCRFCQARSYYAPFRCKSLPRTIGHIKNTLPGTGFETFSLSTLSAGDYPQMKEILELIPQVISPDISFSVSSLRPAAISPYLLSTISLFRRTGITIVPEAGSERLRRVINKDVTDREIFQAIDLACRHNWQKIKLYFMIGLPTETEQDIDAIVTLVEQILEKIRAHKKKMGLHISFSPFVPKPHTPLQWARMENLAEIDARIARLKNSLKKYRWINMDFHAPQNAIIETILTRGDNRVGGLLLAALQAGEIFSAWAGECHFATWEALIDRFNCREFLTEIDPEEPLPWDFIQVNYTKEHLAKEYRKALAGEMTPPCSPDRCRVCQGCAHGFPAPGSQPGDTNEAGILPQIPQPPAPRETTFQQIRLFYEKKDDFIFFSHLSLIKYLERLIRKAGLEFKCSGGFHPRIKLSTLPPLPVYATGLNEVAEIYVPQGLKEQDILNTLNRASGDFQFQGVLACPHSPSLTRDIAFIHYRMMLAHLQSYAQEILKNLSATDAVVFDQDLLSLRIDYAHGGQERFARIYKLIDPEKKLTRHLTRTQVTFRSISTL